MDKSKVTVENIDSLKLKLSKVVKIKISVNNEGIRLRKMESLKTDELSSLKLEIDFATDQLKQLMSQINQVRHQSSLVTICAASEKRKIEGHITNINNHKMNFDELFHKVQQNELRKSVIKQNKKDEQSVKMKKEKELEEKNNMIHSEILAIENECEVMKRECSVLKKRNTAIALKLRRKLVETETFRKELNKKSK